MLGQSISALVLTSATVVIHAVGTVYVAIPAGRVWNTEFEKGLRTNGPMRVQLLNSIRSRACPTQCLATLEWTLRYG